MSKKVELTGSELRTLSEALEYHINDLIAWADEKEMISPWDDYANTRQREAINTHKALLERLKGLTDE